VSRKLVSAALFLAALAVAQLAGAQMMRPPAFAGGIPGVAQFQAIQMQRQQARALLYREALEELRKNPAAADLPECRAGQDAAGGQCLARAEASSTAPAASPASPVAPAAGRRVAILVGNNAYPAPIPALETPIADITQIAAVLRSRFGYETRLVKDAGKAQIIDALNALAADTRPDDSVLLFYAGHGYLLDDVKMGYWIPVDASVKTAKGWISNSDISRLLAAIPSRQLMLISDSCYSGTLTSERKVTQGRDLPPEQILQQRSVLVLSSGADEPVSDEGKEGHSIFAWNLIKTLQSAGGLTPGAQVWSKVSKGVTAEYPQQPQYGAVVSAGHTEGGDFLFRTP
jgi:uncharacterized caspase-like protein